VGNLAGAEPRTLHVDITRGKPVDDNAFQVELATIVDNSLPSRLGQRERVP
jgi:hypothetical protein